MRIDVLYNSMTGEMRPNLSQDRVENDIYDSPKYKFPNRAFFKRPRNSKSNLSHNSTQLRIGHRRARLTSSRNLDIII